jgi:hypothetical protein
MILDRGTMNCSGKCHSIKLTICDYFLDSPMISIQIGGAYMILGVQRLQFLGVVTFNIHNFFM